MAEPGYKITTQNPDGTVTTTDTRTMEEVQAEALARVLSGRDNELQENIGAASISALVFEEHDPAGGYLTTPERDAIIAAARVVRDKMAASKAAYAAATTREEYDAIKWPE